MTVPSAIAMAVDSMFVRSQVQAHRRVFALALPDFQHSVQVQRRVAQHGVFLESRVIVEAEENLGVRSHQNRDRLIPFWLVGALASLGPLRRFAVDSDLDIGVRLQQARSLVDSTAFDRERHLRELRRQRPLLAIGARDGLGHFETGFWL